MTAQQLRWNDTRQCNVSCSPQVGQTLSVAAPDNLQLQWLREDPSDARVSIISGAVRHQVCCIGCRL